MWRLQIKCRPEQVPDEGNDSINSASHHKCVSSVDFTVEFLNRKVLESVSCKNLKLSFNFFSYNPTLGFGHMGKLDIG
ncbi:hypothetical protein CUMW_129280 [Citrus unshiu]|nr:hypothetical protein CUMW_129280 [Citrus unshiu]